MTNTLKDVRTVSALVNFITDIGSCPGVTSSDWSRATSTSSRILFTNDVKIVLRRMTKKSIALLKGKLKGGFLYEDFNQLSISLERRLLQKVFSTITFLKYCCQICVLALQASNLGLKPAPRLAELYILCTVKKFRSRAQFSNDNWRYMSFVVEKYLKDYKILS